MIKILCHHQITFLRFVILKWIPNNPNLNRTSIPHKPNLELKVSSYLIGFISKHTQILDPETLQIK